jgi:hypothetical protein
LGQDIPITPEPEAMTDNTVLATYIPLLMKSMKEEKMLRPTSVNAAI